VMPSPMSWFMVSNILCRFFMRLANHCWACCLEKADKPKNDNQRNPLKCHPSICGSGDPTGGARNWLPEIAFAGRSNVVNHR
jgi:hypothetical protein